MVNMMIKAAIWKLRRKMKKLGCRMKVAYQLGEDGRYSRVKIEFSYDSDTAST